MLEQRTLVELEVRRRDHRDGVGARLRCVRRERDRVGGRLCAAVSGDLQSPGRGRDEGLDRTAAARRGRRGCPRRSFPARASRPARPRRGSRRTAVWLPRRGGRRRAASRRRRGHHGACADSTGVAASGGLGARSLVAGCGEVEREGDRLAVEVAAADDPAAAGRERVRRRRRRRPGRRAGCRSRELSSMSRTRRRWSSASRTAPWTCGHAAQRVRVLDLVRVSRGGRAWSAAVAQEVAQLRGDRDLARVRPGELVGRRERDVRAEQRLDAHRRRRRSRCAPAGPRRPAASAPIAPIICVPLRSARPSLASSVERLEAGLAQGDRAPARPAPPSSTWPRPISGSARWASGARSPDAPTLPCSGTTGWMPRSRKREQPVDEQRPAAAVAERQGVRAQQEHRPDDLARERRRRRPPRGSSAGSPGARPASAGSIERRREVAEAGRHAVDDGALGDEGLDDVARLLHPLAGVDVERGRRAVAGDRLDVGDGQVGAGQDDRSADAVARGARGPGRSAGPPAQSPCRG